LQNDAIRLLNRVTILYEKSEAMQQNWWSRWNRNFSCWVEMPIV